MHSLGWWLLPPTPPDNAVAMAGLRMPFCATPHITMEAAALALLLFYCRRLVRHARLCCREDAAGPLFHFSSPPCTFPALHGPA